MMVTVSNNQSSRQMSELLQLHGACYLGVEEDPSTMNDTIISNIHRRCIHTSLVMYVLPA